MAEPLYRLLAWLSPAYPIGAFSYSHGIETAVEEGFIRDRVSLETWLRSVLLQGTGAIDGALFAAAWRALRSFRVQVVPGPPTLRTGRPSMPLPSARRHGAARRRWRSNRASRAARSCR